jgi:hypothetical protein
VQEQGLGGYRRDAREPAHRETGLCRAIARYEMSAGSPGARLFREAACKCGNRSSSALGIRVEKQHRISPARPPARVARSRKAAVFGITQDYGGWTRVAHRLQAAIDGRIVDHDNLRFRRMRAQRCHAFRQKLTCIPVDHDHGNHDGSSTVGNRRKYNFRKSEGFSGDRVSKSALAMASERRIAHRRAGPEFLHSGWSRRLLLKIEGRS